MVRTARDVMTEDAEALSATATFARPRRATMTTDSAASE